ncbi:MAG: YdcF family protein [Corynebacterium sp.]|uniref:YdcF family protein n=1 Tax=unclassified Corynebacterium TaxID=2624378 RepID=UPI0026490308|nr:YdcF family protein [Corynebacterium sp.]MDN5582214.1 YdcF family protein [Corynebacterium sp.]MDN5721155.1 YdcF family protein [Corynebacterium sp.]MDN6325589.1 YdcF family protein [Corynebacterium sp.]MDN6386507.1 YdcF family protein [Corynebacterium sp.]MDN6510019.1 YdcF family protein [Corynebacterium sp.]
MNGRTLGSTAGRTAGAGIRGLIYMVVGTVVIAIVLTLATAAHVWAYARQDDRTQADTILVLGAAQYNGTPSQWFAARLDHAVDLYEEGVSAHITTIGGKLEGDVYTEAEAGADYLREQGVPDEAITEINEGADTLGSAEAFAPVAEENGWDRVLVVTDPNHSLRATSMVGDQGVDAHASPTRQGPAVSSRKEQLDAIIHETGGLMYYRATEEGGGDYTVDED